MRRLISVCMAAAFLFIAANAGFAQTHTMGKEAVVDALTPIRPVKSAKAKPVRAQSEDGTQSAQGTLKEVLKEALGWEGASVVYIVSTDLLKAKGMTPDDVKAITFLPDPVLYDADAYEVFVDDITPKMARENRKKKKNAPKTLYVRLLTKANDVAPEVAPPAPDPTGKPEPPATPGALELRVKAEGYEAGRWARSAPKFTLSGIPEGGKRYFYAVIAYDEQFVILSKDSYTANAPGSYSLRFTIMDGIGDIVAQSEVYDLRLDFDDPVNLYVALTGASGKQFSVSAEDKTSGIDAYSVDGGYTWHEPDESGAYFHATKPGLTYPAGAIRARDKAGNVTVYANDFFIPEAETGGGGGGGKKTKKIKHAPPGDVSFDPYDALELTLPTGEMSELTVGDTLLPLALTDEEGNPALFTARFDRWGATQESEQTPADTLVLCALDGETPAVWDVNGVVYRMLANSGIQYLCLCQGEGLAAMATEGFVAGTAYTHLKQQGVSTTRFDYEIRQAGAAAAFFVGVQALEDTQTDQEYALTDDDKQAMYLYNVVVGDAQALRQPFDKNSIKEEGI